jgi:hypothetical protein
MHTSNPLQKSPSSQSSLELQLPDPRAKWIGAKANKKIAVNTETENALLDCTMLTPPVSRNTFGNYYLIIVALLLYLYVYY